MDDGWNMVFDPSVRVSPKMTSPSLPPPLLFVVSSQESPYVVFLSPSSPRVATGEGGECMDDFSKGIVW